MLIIQYRWEDETVTWHPLSYVKVNKMKLLTLTTHSCLRIAPLFCVIYLTSFTIFPTMIPLIVTTLPDELQCSS